MPPTPKRALNTLADPVHIAADGTWYLQGSAYFIKAMYVNTSRTDYSPIAQGGWNTNMWATVW